MFANFSSIRKVLLNSFAFLYFSMQIYFQQCCLWVEFLACCCPADSKSERSQSQFSPTRSIM
jgi:hypothetical protein